jgi:hypothetical protein
VIESADQQLRAWLEPLVEGAKLSFDAPPVAADGTAPVVNVYLFAIDRPPQVAPVRNPPFEVRLGYLVSTWASDPVAAHALLDRILTSAMEQAQFEVEFGSTVSALWPSAAMPRPAFVLRLRATQERGLAIAPPIREAPRLENVGLSKLSGVVCAPDGTAIMNAVVEIAALARSATSDADGKFVFMGIPRTLDVALHVRAKGHELDVQRPASAADDELRIVVPV